MYVLPTHKNPKDESDYILENVLVNEEFTNEHVSVIAYYLLRTYYGGRPIAINEPYLLDDPVLEGFRVTHASLGKALRGLCKIIGAVMYVADSGTLVIRKETPADILEGTLALHQTNLDDLHKRGVPHG